MTAADDRDGSTTVVPNDGGAAPVVRTALQISTRKNETGAARAPVPIQECDFAQLVLAFNAASSDIILSGTSLCASFEAATAPAMVSTL